MAPMITSANFTFDIIFCCRKIYKESTSYYAYIEGGNIHAVEGNYNNRRVGRYFGKIC